MINDCDPNCIMVAGALFAKLAIWDPEPVFDGNDEVTNVLTIQPKLMKSTYRYKLTVERVKGSGESVED
jgi:hypothetical protein